MPRARSGMGITGGNLVSVPGPPETRRYFQMMTRFSSAFALLADVSMFVIGGSLKRKEKISARLGDMLSMLYMASATVKRYHDEGRQKEDLPLLTWAMCDTLLPHPGGDGRRGRELPQPFRGRVAAPARVPEGPHAQRAARQGGRATWPRS